MATEYLISEHRRELGKFSLNCAAGSKAGAPMVMLHGITNWWKTFESVMPVFGSQWTEYALDLRGHGHSSHVAEGYRWSEFAKDTLAFLQSCLGEPAILVGHSLGANIAIEVAATAPEAVKALVLEEPVLYAYRGERLGALLLFPFLQGYERIARVGGSADEMLPALAELHNEPNAEALRGKANSLSLMDPDALKMMLDGTATEDYDTDDFLRRIECPTLLLRGEPALGSAISDDDAARASAHLSSMTVISVSGLGHWIHRERPQEFCEMVVRFLDNS